jgi:hypothetical protein
MPTRRASLRPALVSDERLAPGLCGTGRRFVWAFSSASRTVRVPRGSTTKKSVLLRFGSCARNERDESSKSEFCAIRLPIDVWSDRGIIFTSTNRVCALPLQGLSIEIGLVFPAQHAVCLVHGASRVATDLDAS